jgi:hypothetical protein
MDASQVNTNEVPAPLMSDLFELHRPELGANFKTAVTVNSEDGTVDITIGLPSGHWGANYSISADVDEEHVKSAWQALTAAAFLGMMHLQEELLGAAMEALPKYGTKPEKALLSALVAFHRVGRHLQNGLRAIIEEGPERDAAEDAARANDDARAAEAIVDQAITQAVEAAAIVDPAIAGAMIVAADDSQAPSEAPGIRTEPEPEPEYIAPMTPAPVPEEPVTADIPLAS